MLYPRPCKPGIIANEQIRIQIEDTHDSLEILTYLGLPAGGGQLNRTLLGVNDFFVVRSEAKDRTLGLKR